MFLSDKCDRAFHSYALANFFAVRYPSIYIIHATWTFLVIAGCILCGFPPFGLLYNLANRLRNKAAQHRYLDHKEVSACNTDRVR